MSAEEAAKIRRIVLGPGEGIAVGGSAGTPTVVKVHGKDVGGAYSLLDMEVPPGNGNRLHRHVYAEEAFYVVEGELTIRLGDEDLLAPAGSFVLVPRGTPHFFANRGARPAKAVFIFSPPGPEYWFEEMTELRKASPTGTLDWDSIATLARKHGTEFLE